MIGFIWRLVVAVLAATGALFLAACGYGEYLHQRDERERRERRERERREAALRMTQDAAPVAWGPLRMEYAPTWSAPARDDDAPTWSAPTRDSDHVVAWTAPPSLMLEGRPTDVDFDHVVDEAAQRAARRKRSRQRRS